MKTTTETTVKPRSTHSPLQSIKNTNAMKTLKATIPSSPMKNHGLSTGAVTALKKGAHTGNVDVNAVMLQNGKEKLALQVILSDDEKNRKEWITAEYRPTLRVKQYIWGGVPLGILPKAEWVVTNGENKMIMKPNYFRNSRKIARALFHVKGSFMKKKLMRNCRFQLLDYVTGLSPSKEAIIFVEKVKWMPK
jgi:hypothetical protein